MLEGRRSEFSSATILSMNKNTSKTPYILGAVLGIAVIGSLVAWIFGIDKTTAPTAENTAPETTTGTGEDTNQTNTGSAFKDGTYRQTGTYSSPAGAETVDVSLTLKEGVITDSSFTGKASNPASIRLQTAFAQGYRQYVVGKKIDEVDLSVVNGSSLTPKGFMEALDKIEAEARS